MGEWGEGVSKFHEMRTTNFSSTGTTIAKSCLGRHSAMALRVVLLKNQVQNIINEIGNYKNKFKVKRKKRSTKCQGLMSILTFPLKEMQEEELNKLLQSFSQLLLLPVTWNLHPPENKISHLLRPLNISLL